jgi:hypothetical protein
MSSTHQHISPATHQSISHQHNKIESTKTFDRKSVLKI